MSSFQALMALSASQTKQSQSAVQVTLRERQQKEAVKRKEQEERERKEREREQQMRLKHFEEQKKDEERQKREEEKRNAFMAELQRREGEQRNALLYGPKKASKWPTSASGVKEAVRRNRLPGANDDNDDESPAGSFPTREELRQRKQEAEQRRLYASTRRSSGSGSYSRQGKRLPGGAVDITTPGRAVENGNFKSVKDRLAAQPITLTKLNVVKRDTRTIDEIVQDRAKAKILDGDKAREFSDWFGSSKKKEPTRKASPLATGLSTWAPSTAPATPTASQSTTSTVGSGANTPVSQRGTSGPSGTAATAAKKAPVQQTRPAPVPTSSKSSLAAKLSALTPAGATKSHAQQALPARASTVNGKSAKPSASLSSSQSSAKPYNSYPTQHKKRSRSDSRSESPPPKRRAYDDEDDEVPGNISSMIWNMFGRNRDNYVSMDVFSDEEDMEADADSVLKEEARSARIAAMEDQVALEEERRHEEEKRRRKKEREARAMNSR